MKIYVKNLKSRLETDNPDLMKALYELYSFKIPGAEYSGAYKRRQWDGKSHFLTRDGKFSSGLLPRILADLKKIDCEPEVITESSKEIKLNLDYDIEGFNYYVYQENLIIDALKHKRGIVKSPTGSGKTLIMAGLIKALEGRKMVILFNAKQLLTQTYDFLTKTCGMDNIGLCFGEGYIYGDIMLCTVQSIEKVLDTHLEEAEVLMVDECHEFGNGKTTLAALNSFPKAVYRLGFTATPPRDNIPRYNLEGALGSVIEAVNTAELVEEGKLTKPYIQLINRAYSASGADEDMGYLDVYDEYIVYNEERNNQIKEIVNDIKSKNKTARILVLTKSLDHGRALEDLLGGNCEFLQGCDSVGERYEAISRFRGCREPSILIGTKILQTGVNIEEITHFINARGMKSEIATLQALGRALRTHESKDKVYVYDFLDKEKYLREHSLSRKRHYEREGHEVIVC
jgi:superfamily II DNA or RNA helicase|tara:strand:+ start:217 stop:1587 length:1371 start_codon:yes stop_codon:yes gene_type:complete